MNLKKFFIAFVVTWVWIFAFGFVVHAKLLHSTYSEMPALFRAEADVQFPIILLGQLVLAFFFNLIFVRGFGSGGGIGGGFRYGVLIGLFLCGLDLIHYAVQPLTTALLGAWCIAGLIEMAVAGMIVGALYKPGAIA